MDFKAIWQLSLLVLGSVGGGALVVGAFSTWLGKVWAARILEQDKLRYASELETLKSRFSQELDRFRTSLKKSEFIFQKQYEAASEFTALARPMLPQKIHPDEDWAEGLDRIAADLDKHEKTLLGFVARHAAVLSDEAHLHIERAINRASDGRFEVDENGDPTGDGRHHANEFFEAINAAEKELIHTLRRQSDQ